MITRPIIDVFHVGSKACRSQNATPMNADSFPISSNRHLRLGKHMAMPGSGVYESRVDVDVWLSYEIQRRGAPITTCLGGLMVKFFSSCVESGAMEPSSNETSRNLGAWYATSWLRFSSHHNLESTPPSESILSRVHTGGEWARATPKTSNSVWGTCRCRRVGFIGRTALGVHRKHMNL